MSPRFFPTGSRSNPRSWGGIVILSLIAIALVACVAIATRRGIGLSPDSMGYVMGARSFAAGQGIVMPDDNGVPQVYTHLAPGLMVILGMLHRLHASIFVAGRGFALLCLAGSIGLTGVLIAAGSRRPTLAAVLGTLGVFTFVPMLQLFGMLVSEPLFCLAWLGSMALLLRAQRKQSMAWLIGAGAAAAVAFLARYASVAVVLPMAICIGLRGDRKMAQRLAAAATFAGIAIAPVAAWLCYGFLRTDRVGNRQLLFHPPTVGQWQELARTVAGWVMPGRWHVPIGVGAVLASVLVVLTALLDRRQRRRLELSADACGVRDMLWCVAVGYALFIPLSVTLFDAATPMDDRIFLPVRVSVAMLGAMVWLGSAELRVRRIAGAAALVLIGVQTLDAAHWAKVAPVSEMGMNSLVWQNSPCIKAAGRLPRDCVIYTNAAGAIYLLEDRLCKETPALIDPATGASFEPAYYQSLPSIWQDLHDHHGYVVYYRRQRRSRGMPEDRLRADLGLRRVKNLSDGAIYELDPARPDPPTIPPQFSTMPATVP